MVVGFRLKVELRQDVYVENVKSVLRSLHPGGNGTGPENDHFLEATEVRNQFSIMLSSTSRAAITASFKLQP